MTRFFSLRQFVDCPEILQVVRALNPIFTMTWNPLHQGKAFASAWCERWGALRRSASSTAPALIL